MLDHFMDINVKGGQNSDGSRKMDSWSMKRRVAGVYDPDKKQYIAVEEIASKCDAYLGALRHRLSHGKLL